MLPELIFNGFYYVISLSLLQLIFWEPIHGDIPARFKSRPCFPRRSLKSSAGGRSTGFLCCRVGYRPVRSGLVLRRETAAGIWPSARCADRDVPGRKPGIPTSQREPATKSRGLPDDLPGNPLLSLISLEKTKPTWGFHSGECRSHRRPLFRNPDRPSCSCRCGGAGPPLSLQRWRGRCFRRGPPSAPHS